MRETRRQEGESARMPVAWSIAGLDPSGGAGVTADVMTFAAHSVFGCTAVSALTVQNTQGVRRVEPTPTGVLRETLEALLDDVPPAGIKLGMLASAANATAVADVLHAVRQRSPGMPIVVDPVIRSSSGSELLSREGVAVLREQLLPLADWVTPNWAELQVLAGCTVGTLEEALAAAHDLQRTAPGLGVIVTGGDQEPPVDLFVPVHGEPQVLQGEHVATTSTHGTGCAFSSAFLAQLLRGSNASAAATGAKRFVEGALRHAPGIGKGKGPGGLLWPLLHPE